MTDPRYTDEDLERVALIVNDMRYDNPEEVARAVLEALADRLLPPGVEIHEKFGVMGDETIVKKYRRPYVMGHASRQSAEEYIADQRENWPDHNLRLVHHWRSEWVEVVE